MRRWRIDLSWIGLVQKAEQRAAIKGNAERGMHASVALNEL